jgi:4-amino-4-deoxy-L-arabinose transferase-like glycosyltransferase
MAPTTTLPLEQATPRAAQPRPSLETGLLVGAALAVLVGHALVNFFGPYGLQRDEFLYLAMGRHLHLWGMDFPPLIALAASAGHRLLGDSIPAIRLVPALAHALLVLLAGVAAREFGGRRFAQGLAALCVALCTLFLRAGSLFQPTILDQLWWTLALLALARIGRTAEEDGGAGDPVAWVGLGLFGGLGLLTKFSIGFLGVAMLVGLVLSPTRRALLTRWPWEAALLALLIGSPSIGGQIQLGFPVVQQMRDLTAIQLQHVGYLDFVMGQLMMLGPILLLPILGILRLLTVPAARGHRVVAWACLAAFALLLVLHGKAYYIGPIYPALIGAGAAALELGTGVLAGHVVGRVTGNVVRGLVVAIILIYGILALPFGTPVLGPGNMAAYVTRAQMAAAARTNTGVQLRLPQDYADMIGWPEEAAAVSRAFKSLTPEQRAQAVVFASNWGEAGALDYYGPRVGLPPVICNSGSYWFWGPGAKPGNVMVLIGTDSADAARDFRSVRVSGRMRNPWGVPEEQHAPILIAEGPLKTLQQVWPSWAGRN